MKKNKTDATNSVKTESRIAVYPGTFDPVTMGHLDIIHRATRIFDRVIVAVARNIEKVPFFSLEERIQLLEDCFPDNDQRVTVEAVSHGLLVDYALERGARSILRGLRAVSDFDYELQLALMNRRLEREVETVFMMTGFRWIFISSTIIKNAALNGGDVSGLVPDHVCQKFREKLANGAE